MKNVNVTQEIWTANQNRFADMRMSSSLGELRDWVTRNKDAFLINAVGLDNSFSEQRLERFDISGVRFGVTCVRYDPIQRYKYLFGPMQFCINDASDDDAEVFCGFDMFYDTGIQIRNGWHDHNTKQFRGYYRLSFDQWPVLGVTCTLLKDSFDVA